MSKQRFHPAYERDTSSTTRINPEDLADILLRASDDYLIKVRRELCKNGYWVHLDRIKRVIRILS